MKIVGSGFGHYVDHSAGVAPVLGAERRVVDLEFGHRVDRRLERDLVLHHVVEVHAVENVDPHRRRIIPR